MNCKPTFHLRGICAGALMLLGSALHAADWPAAHQDASNNAAVAIPAQVTSLSGSLAWSTGDQHLVNGAAVTVANQRFYAPVHQADGATTQVAVKCFDAVNGNLVWQSAPLAEGISRAYGSTSAVVADAANNAVYYATGNTVYRWNALTGAPIWAQPIDASNTTTSPTVQRWDVVNSSITLGGGRLFVETYGGFETNYKQIVALDAATGAVEWFVNDEGQGQGTPVYLEAGLNSAVYTAGVDVVRCYDAATGTLVWDSEITPFAPWDVAPWAIFSSLTEQGGRIYVAAGDPSFFATTTTLICADAETGELLWEVPAPHSDVPPLVLNGKVYIYGGTAPGVLASYDALTGAPGFRTVVTPSFIFRDYIAATQDRIYVTDGEYGGQTLRILDPNTGATLDSAPGFFGPITIDSHGGLYVHDAAHSHSVSGLGRTVPVELSAFTLD